MKRHLAILLTALALQAQPPLPPAGSPTTLTFEWDYATNDLPVMSFLLYASPDVARPLTNWAHVITVTATNRATVPALVERRFFAIRASNIWGVSDFSNVAWTPALPGHNVNLNVRKTE